jgi:hypothetical protein
MLRSTVSGGLMEVEQMRKLLSCLCLFLWQPFCLSSQEELSYVSFGIQPGIEIPIAASSSYYNLGAMGSLRVAYKPPLTFPFYVSLDLAYGLNPFEVESPQYLNVLAFGGGLGIDWRLFRRLGLIAYTSGGYYLGFTRDAAGDVIAGGNPYIWAGTGLDFAVTPRLSAGVGSVYRNYFGKPRSLYTGLGVYLAATYRVPINGGMPSPCISQPGAPRHQAVSEGGGPGRINGCAIPRENTGSVFPAAAP